MFVQSWGTRGRARQEEWNGMEWHFYLCSSWLGNSVPFHPACPESPRLTVSRFMTERFLTDDPLMFLLTLWQLGTTFPSKNYIGSQYTEHWLIDWLINWLFDWSIDWLIDWLIGFLLPESRVLRSQAPGLESYHSDSRNFGFGRSLGSKSTRNLGQSQSYWIGATGRRSPSQACSLWYFDW